MCAACNPACGCGDNSKQNNLDMKSEAPAEQWRPHVLHITQKFVSGIATYMCEVGGIQAQYYGAEQVTFLIPSEDIGHRPPGLNHVDVLTFTSSKRNPWSLIRAMIQIRRAIRDIRPDIIHIHSTFAGVLVRLPLLLVLRSKRPAIVYGANGWAFSMEVGSIKRRAYALVERILARATDAIVNVSEYEHAEAIKANLPAQILYCIPSGISPDTTLLSPADLGARKRGGPVRMLFVGRIDRQKGFDLLMSHMSRLRDADVTLDVVGAPVLAESKAFKGTDKIKFHGWQPREVAARMMREVDVLVVPSRWEGFGLVAAEAMRAGTALLVSNRGALPELVRPGVNGEVFKLEDATEFERIVRGTTKDQWHRMGDGGKRIFLEQYTAERLCRQLDRLYRQVFATRGDV